MTSASLEDAQAVLASQPFSTLMGTTLSQYDDAGVTLELELNADHLQQHGYVHGGVQCYLADNALTFAGGQRLGPAVLTAGVNLTYLRPAAGEKLIARASVQAATSRSAAGEKLIARASVQAATSRSAVTQVEISAVKDGEEYVCSVGSGNISAMRK